MEKDRGLNKKRIMPMTLPLSFDMPEPNLKEGRLFRIEEILDSINSHLDNLEENAEESIDNLVERIVEKNDKIEKNINEKLDKIEKNINEKLDKIEERILLLVNLLI